VLALLTLSVALSVQAEPQKDRYQDKAVTATSDKSFPHHSTLGLLRAVPSVARLEGVLFMARESQRRIATATTGKPSTGTDRTIQRVPKVHVG
jgi:hypothetical protein